MRHRFGRSRRLPVETGREQMLREHAVALSDFERTGFVHIRGETWSAVSSRPVKAGQRLNVRRIEGLTLEVEPED